MSARSSGCVNAALSHSLDMQQGRLIPSATAHAVRSALLIMACAIATPLLAQAVEPVAASTQATKTFNVPAGPLATALTGFAADSGVTVSAQPDLVKSISSQGLKGSYTLQEGLSRLLDGTGLEAVHLGSGGYVLKKSVLPSASKIETTGSETTLPSVQVTATRVSTTEGSGSYTTGAMNTATRLNLSMRETPQSISVVTRQQMDDMSILSVEDIVNITTGLTLQRGATERASFYSRGFPISYFTEDGLPISSDGDTLGFATLAMYDRVEVLRGAAGMATGAGTPAGTLNFVRKRPTAEKQVSITASAGRWDNYRTELDASGPLNEAKTLRGRAVLAYQDADTFISNYGHKRTLAYATVDADVARDTTLSVGFHYNNEKNNGSTWYGLPTSIDGSFLPFDRSATNAPDWTFWDKTNTRVFAELEHRFANDWKAKFAVQHQDDELDSLVTGVGRVGNTNTFQHVAVNPFLYDRQQESVDLQASGPFSLLGRKHEMVVGVNYRTRETDDDGYRTASPYSYTFDPTNWDPSAQPQPASPVRYFGSNVRTTQTGIYTTGRFSLADPLALLVGARVDWYNHSQVSYSLNNANVATTTPSGYKVTAEVTPYVGLVYDINDTYSVYGSWTSIFNPQTNVDVNGKLLDPVQGINMEAGIKGEYFGGALNVSAAVFRIRQQNLATAVLPASLCKASTSCSEAAGEVQSEGFELEVAGSLTPNWQLSAGYTYNTAEYAKSQRASNGTITPAGTPYAVERPSNLFRLATNYKLPGELNKWRIGAAVRAQDGIYKTGNVGTPLRPVTIRQGGYTIVDLMAGWQVDKNLDLRFNLTNLFDKTYYQTIGSADSGNAFGEPRSFVMTARYKF